MVRSGAGRRDDRHAHERRRVPTLVQRSARRRLRSQRRFGRASVAGGQEGFGASTDANDDCVAVGFSFGDLFFAVPVAYRPDQGLIHQLDHFDAGFQLESAQTSLIGEDGVSVIRTIARNRAATIILTPTARCETDVSGDRTLDVVAFQAAWKDRVDIGDCDANGVYNVLDLVCFQQLFQAGCE